MIEICLDLDFAPHSSKAGHSGNATISGRSLIMKWLANRAMTRTRQCAADDAAFSPTPRSSARDSGVNESCDVSVCVEGDPTARKVLDLVFQRSSSPLSLDRRASCAMKLTASLDLRPAGADILSRRRWRSSGSIQLLWRGRHIAPVRHVRMLLCPFAVLPLRPRHQRFVLLELGDRH